MQKSKQELVVGISLFLALFVLIGGVMWLKEVNVSRKLVEYTVLFPDVGVLQTGDPVSVNGVKRGTAAKIYFLNDKVAVDIKLDQNIVLTDSCAITVQNIGLMGERQIGIKLSSAGTILSPATGDKKTYIHGYFDAGIAEAMGLLGNVLTDVKELLSTVSVVLEETVGDTAFPIYFNSILTRLDTITVAAEQLVQDNKTGITQAVTNLQAVSADIRTMVDAQSGSISTIVDNGEELTRKALAIADQIDSLTTSASVILSDINAGKGTIGLMVKDEEFYYTAKATLAELDTLVRDIDKNGLKLRIKPGFRK